MRRGDNAGPGVPRWHTQENRPASGGTVYAHQGSGDQIIYAPGQDGRRRRGTDSIVLLVALVVDVAFFFYGMLAYTGRNTGADTWRAGIFLVLLAVTGSLFRRWLRRRV
jgi:hypothetical protein